MIAIYVMFVDDEPDIRHIIEMSLGIDPLFVSRGCRSGEVALATAAEWRPDLVLLDVVMPDLDGPATLSKLRQHPETSRTPVIFMTARAQACECERLVELGAAGVIPKPFDPITLPTQVRRYIAVENKLAPMRETFFRRVRADAIELASCQLRLRREQTDRAALVRVKEIAHALAGSCGIYGFAGTGSAFAALEETALEALGGRVAASDVAPLIERLLVRVAPR